MGRRCCIINKLQIPKQNSLSPKYCSCILTNSVEMRYTVRHIYIYIYIYIYVYQYIYIYIYMDMCVYTDVILPRSLYILGEPKVRILHIILHTKPQHVPHFSLAQGIRNCTRTRTSETLDHAFRASGSGALDICISLRDSSPIRPLWCL